MAASQPKPPFLNPVFLVPSPPFIPAASSFSHPLAQPLPINGSWKSKLFDSANPSSSRDLVFLEPTVEGNKHIASCRRTEIELIVKEWEGKLMGFLLGKKRPHLPSLKKAMVSKWSLKCPLDLTFHGSTDAVLLNFGSGEEKAIVLDLGPWFFSGRLLVLKQWRRLLSMNDFDTSSVPIWVRLPNLSVEFWSKDSHSRIGSLLGRPLFSDEMTASRARSSYARICVEISASKVFPSEILVDIEGSEHFSQEIKAEWKPTRCSTCSVFFHDSTTCPLTKVPSTVKPCIPPMVKEKEVRTVVRNRKIGTQRTFHAGTPSTTLQKGGMWISSGGQANSQGLPKPPVALPLDVSKNFAVSVLNQPENVAPVSGLLISPEAESLDTWSGCNHIPASDLQIGNVISGGLPVESDDHIISNSNLISTISEKAGTEGGVPSDSVWKGGVPEEEVHVRSQKAVSAEVLSTGLGAVVFEPHSPRSTLVANSFGFEQVRQISVDARVDDTPESGHGSHVSLLSESVGVERAHERVFKILTKPDEPVVNGLTSQSIAAFAAEGGWHSVLEEKFPKEDNGSIASKMAYDSLAKRKVLESDIQVEMSKISNGKVVGLEGGKSDIVDANIEVNTCEIEEVVNAAPGFNEGSCEIEDESSVESCPPGFSGGGSKFVKEKSTETAIELSESEEESSCYSSRHARMIREKLGICILGVGNADKAFANFCRSRQKEIESNRKKSVVPDASMKLMKQVGKKGISIKGESGRRRKF